MNKKMLVQLGCVLFAALILFGCGGSNTGSSGSGDPGNQALHASVVDCNKCHQDATGKWLSSAHSNQALKPYYDRSLPQYQACAQCHTPDYDGVSSAILDAKQLAKPQHMVACQSCHGAGPFHLGVSQLPSNLAPTKQYSFDSGVVVTAADLGSSAACFDCHKGRIGGQNAQFFVDVDANGKKGMRSYDAAYVHYSPAFAVLMGAQAQMAPMYPNQTYQGWAASSHGKQTCLSCHDEHTLEVRTVGKNGAMFGETCTNCHIPGSPLLGFTTLKSRTAAYASALKAEIKASMQQIYTAEVQANCTTPEATVYRAEAVAALCSIFTATSVDTALETHLKARIAWFPTKELAIAAANWKLFGYEDKAAWAHNSRFARQVLYDAISSLGVNPAVAHGLTRP